MGQKNGGSALKTMRKEKEGTNNTTQKLDADERELSRTTLLPRKQALIYLQNWVGEPFSQLAAGAKYFEEVRLPISQI